MSAGTYAAALRLAQAADLLRVLASVGRDTEEDHNAVRTALSHWDGVTPARSRRGRPSVLPEPTTPRFETTHARYVKTGVWR